MIGKRYRTGQIVGATLPFIIDDYSAKKHKTMTGYKAYDTKTLKKCEELTDLLNNYEDENKELKQSYKEFEDECQSTFNAMSRKQNDLYRKNFKLKEENEQLKSELSKKQEHIVLLENKIHRMREAIHKLEWLATHRNADLQRENWQLKQRCKELRNDLIDYSALIKMLEDAKALDIEDMIWNTMGYRTQTEFDDDFTNCREDAKKRWKE